MKKIQNKTPLELGLFELMQLRGLLVSLLEKVGLLEILPDDAHLGLHLLNTRLKKRPVTSANLQRQIKAKEQMNILKVE